MSNDTEVMKVGEQIAKRKRPDRSKAQTVHVDPGDNTAYTKHSLRVYSLPVVELTNTEAVTARIVQYFEICAKDDMKPSVAGLALALGITKEYLWEIRVGRKGKNPEVANALKKAMQLLDLQMVNYMQNGKINPVSGIFLMKNNFGYADKQEVVVTPNSPLGEAKDTKQLEQRYIDSVVDG